MTEAHGTWARAARACPHGRHGLRGQPGLRAGLRGAQAAGPGLRRTWPPPPVRGPCS
ncbi:hypothetical protein QJS66_08940 [Kocuria rhizophila]|nr:hypothetical protein QJS66_08940 [Kocuria rhizophila]